MLYAGIRPHEVERLTWAQIDLENETIAIEARHSKTGGSRSVTIHPPLRRFHRLLPFRWEPDVLRHTFATYQLKQFRSYTELQYEIGHRSSSLLRTRYVNFNGLRNTNLLA